jgi:hypothetical protein
VNFNSKEERKLFPDKQNKAFNDFQKSVKENGILDAKMTLLFHLAATIAFGCYP